MTLEEKMRVGYIVEDYNNWNFFKEIADNLSTRYSTNIFVPPNMSFPIFRERINRSLFQYKIKSFIKENQVVFFEWVGPYLAEISKHTNSCFLITRLHSYELYEWAPLVNWRNVDKIIFISRAMQQKFIEIYPEVADKTIVIYHGVNLNKFQPPKQRLYQGRIGMMGKITPIKRCYEMILALYEVKILGANFHLDLAGPPGIGADFRYTASIKSLIKKLNLTTSVTLRGYVPDTSTWYQNIDIYVSNSYWEGAQVSLMEAMASGCFCLSHAWDGAEEMLPEDQLYLTQNQFLDKLLNYHNECENVQLEQQQRMRQLACERFDLERTIAELDKIISETRKSR